MEGRGALHHAVLGMEGKGVKEGGGDKELKAYRGGKGRQGKLRRSMRGGKGKGNQGGW